ncbi:MAG: response regulator transcription factor [Leptospirales bacterium]
MSRSVLVIEDNKDIAHLLELHLKDIGCKVFLVFDGAEGCSKAIEKSYDLVILDLILPGMDGIEICKRLRGKPDYVPILMLTALSTDLDRVLGLEIGADDYLTKPFNIRELTARVKALFRRVDAMSSPLGTQTSAIICAGTLVIETEKRTVSLVGNPLELTAKEFDLLVHFAKNPGRVYSRTELLDLVWGYDHDGYEHTVNSHINRLRAKIEKDPSRPQFIMTVWGIGYKFSETANRMNP